MSTISPADTLLSVRGLTASVDEKTILHGVDLDVAASETHVIMGPNGAGKSTMGHVIMGDPVYTVTQGSIHFDGQDITDLSCDKRSRAGLFLSFQAPVEIPGVPLSSFLRATLAGREGLEMKGKQFRRRVTELARELGDAATELLALHFEALAAGEGGAQEAGQRHAGDLDGRLEGQEQAGARALVAGEVRDVLAVEVDGALRDGVDGVAHDDVAHRGLAGAVGSHDDVRLAGGDVEVDAVQDGLLIDRRGESAHGQQRIGR